MSHRCLLYLSDAVDDLLCLDFDASHATYNKNRIATDTYQQEFRGVYSSKALADKAGKDYCETYGENLHHVVTIKALDDIINGVQY